ncbi:MAG: methyltransferase domain-containing protein [Syntrophorhabdaceae bacterium]
MKEQDIRPKELFSRYLELSKIDGDRLDRSMFIDIPCPGCGGEERFPQFQKDGYSYMRCRICGSLYCSPRPIEAQLTTIYNQSESARYWSEVFFPAVVEARRERMFRKKAIKVLQVLEERNMRPRSICDVGAGYGIFLEELQRILPEAHLSAIEPDPRLAVRCREKGFETLEKFAAGSGEWAGRFDLVISSEVVEHVFSPLEFVRSIQSLVAVGGMALITGLGYEGFDILLLQENSNSVFPPHHLNFLSVSGFERILTRSGFNRVEVITPGELDVDIVCNAPQCPELVRVAALRGETALAELQEWIRRQKMSSHVWALGCNAQD